MSWLRISRNKKTQHAVAGWEMSILLLVCTLPLLLPFTIFQNIAVQAVAISLTGALAWVCVLARHIIGPLKNPIPRRVWALLGGYLGLMVIGLAARHTLQSDLAGTIFSRIGVVTLLACIGCGLALRRVSSDRIVSCLYVSSCLTGLASIYYSWSYYHSFTRLGGVFYQSDVSAVYFACGLLIGFHLWTRYESRRRLLLGGQLFLALLLLLTQTRAVIALVLLICVFQLVTSKSLTTGSKLKLLLGSLMVLVIASAGVGHFEQDRLINAGYAAGSINYRIDLQKTALLGARHEPFFGYGPAGIDNALLCAKMSSSELIRTCAQGYYFDSSHNIYLDRAIAFGWLSGLCYCAFVVTCMLYMFKNKRVPRTYLYIALLIALYYLTNVTSIELELLLSIVLLQAFTFSKKPD